jgi:hypothetical protein
MSWPLRFRFAGVLILAGLSTSPASSNPFTALFNLAPEQAAAPVPAKDAPAKEECLAQPGKPADGQHWVYRVDGHRRCWFLVPEGTAAVKKTVARRRLAAAEENEAAPRKRSAVADARAELSRPALVETPQPSPPAPAFKVVDAADAAPVPATGAAALVPPPPVLSQPDQLKPADPNPRKGNIKSDMEALFAATPADSDTVAVSVPPATPVAVPIAETSDDRPWWTAPWLGPLLMALGLVLLLGPTLVRRAALVAESLWAGEPEDRAGYLHLESDSQTRPQDRRYPQVTPHRSRQTTEDRRKSRPLGQRNQAYALPIRDLAGGHRSAD